MRIGQRKDSHYGCTVPFMADERDSKKDQRQAMGRKLNWLERSAALIAGAACLGTGGAAAFVTRQEGPPIGLLATGLVFGLIGVGGVMPNRLKVKDTELEFAAVLQQTLDDASGKTKDGVVDVANKLSEVEPAVAAPALRTYAFEQRVLGMLRDALASVPGATLDDVSGESGFDAMIEAPVSEGTPLRNVFVEIRADEATPKVLRRFHAEAVKSPRSAPGADATLLIVANTVGMKSRKQAQDYPGMYLARGDDPDSSSMQRTLMEAISGPALPERAEGSHGRQGRR